MAHKTSPDHAAFPIQDEQSGLLKREYFAAQAMSGMLGNDYLRREMSPTETAIWAVDYADALIDALNKQSVNKL